MSEPLPPVLIVDDEKNMRRSLQTMLGDEGYDARVAESAEEALQLLAHDRYFMVITDGRLGGMSGYELLARIRAQWPEVATLMITAYATTKLAVDWLDYHGVRERFFMLSPGETRAVNAYVGDAWLVTDAHGCVGTFTSTESSHITVEPPSGTASSTKAAKKG